MDDDIIQLDVGDDHCNPEYYARFIKELRERAQARWDNHHATIADGTRVEVKVGMLRDTRNRIPAIAIHGDEDEMLMLHIQNSDMYFLGYKANPDRDDWVSISKDPRELNGQMARSATKFKESYLDMGCNDLTRPMLSFEKIRNALFVLRKSGNQTDLKDACCSIALMICEAARCESVFTDVKRTYVIAAPAIDGTFDGNTVELIHSWNHRCQDYIRDYYGKSNLDYNESLRLVKVKFLNQLPPPVDGEPPDLDQKTGKGATSTSAHNPGKGEIKSKKKNRFCCSSPTPVDASNSDQNSDEGAASKSEQKPGKGEKGKGKEHE